MGAGRNANETMPALINRTFSEVSSNSQLLQRQDSQMTHLTDTGSEDVQGLKRKNSMLKRKLDQLTLALDVQLQKHQSESSRPQTNQEPSQSLKNLLKEKDIQIQHLQQRLQDSKQPRFIPQGYDKMLELQAKLKDSEQRNQELLQEIKHLERIQAEQAKALERIHNETEYPQRINALLEELRAAKERNRQLEQKLRSEEQRGKQHVEQIVRLEETIREIKSLGKRNSIMLTAKGEVNKPYHLMKADERIEEQNRMILHLQTQKDKDYKTLHTNKKLFEKQIAELTFQMEQLKIQLAEKDKDIKTQALKLRELIHDEFRRATIKKNYQELERLAQSPKTSLSRLEQQQNQKLDYRNQVLLKYGKLPLKPGFNKKKINYQDKLALLDIQNLNQDNSVSRALSANRSRSVDPLNKKRLMNSKINIDSAADQIIENSLNQFVVEVQREEHDKAIKNADKDLLDSMYDNPGGKVFDLNHDLNVATQMIRFEAQSQSQSYIPQQLSLMS